MKKFEDVYQCDSITLNVTNNCNLSCTYCFEKAKNKCMMSKETAIKAVEKAYRDLGTDRQPFTINFFGGEPLLNWEAIKAVIDFCNESHYKVRYGITTNLTLLTEEIISYIDDSSMAILVSIDGIKEVHDKNRSNSFDLVIKNLKTLIDRGLGIYVEARMTILPEDMKYAKDGVQMLFDLGVNNFCPMPVYDQEWNESSLSDAKKFYHEMMQFFTDIMNDESNTRNISIKNCDDMIVNIMSPELDDPIMCPIFENTWCTIDYQGDVYACHQGPTSDPDNKEKLLVGTLDEIDETKLTNIQRRATYPKDRCKDCKGRSICKCGCPTENARMTGKYDEPTDSYCDLNIALVEAVREYQDKLLTAKNIRNRMLVIIQENVKLRNYVDLLFNETDMTDKLTLTTRIMHFDEMVANLGDDKILPSFREYIDSKLAVIVSIVLANSNITYDEMKRIMGKLQEVNMSGK